MEKFGIADVQKYEETIAVFPLVRSDGIWTAANQKLRGHTSARKSDTMRRLPDNQDKDRWPAAAIVLADVTVTSPRAAAVVVSGASVVAMLPPLSAKTTTAGLAVGTVALATTW
jgi:hypothetical protein